MELHEVIRYNIKAFLKAAGMSPAELARLSGVHPSTISFFLNKKKLEITSQTIERLARGFGISPAILLQELGEG